MGSISTLFNKKLQRNDWIIIISNLFPVAGVWFLGWSAVEVFIVYALETLIMGVFTVIKLLIAGAAGNRDNNFQSVSGKRIGSLFFVVFFIIHFGIFAGVQTSIFSGVAGINPRGASGMYFFFHWWEFINRDIALMLGIFFMSYLLRDLIPFVINKEYQSKSLLLLMFQPYGRIIIQQFTVILGSMFLVFKLGKVFVLVFALVKILAEVYFDFEAKLRQSLEKSQQQSGKE